MEYVSATETETIIQNLYRLSNVYLFTVFVFTGIVIMYSGNTSSVKHKCEVALEFGKDLVF